MFLYCYSFLSIFEMCVAYTVCVYTNQLEVHVSEPFGYGSLAMIGEKVLSPVEN